MTASTFFWLMIFVTAVPALIWRVVCRRRRRRYRLAAGVWRLQYSPDDRFRLAERLAGRFPVVGAADLRVRDLMYAGDESGHHYLFTVEYTLGLVRAKRRHCRVMRVAESRIPGDLSLALAPMDRPLIDQYQYFAAPAPDQDSRPCPA